MRKREEVGAGRVLFQEYCFKYLFTWKSILQTAFSIPLHPFPLSEERGAIKSPRCEVRQVQVQHPESWNQGESVFEKSQRQWRRYMNRVWRTGWCPIMKARKEKSIKMCLCVFSVCVYACMCVLKGWYCWRKSPECQMYSRNEKIKVRKAVEIMTQHSAAQGVFQKFVTEAKKNNQ